MTRAIGDEGRIGISICLRKPSATIRHAHAWVTSLRRAACRAIGSQQRPRGWSDIDARVAESTPRRRSLGQQDSDIVRLVAHQPYPIPEDGENPTPIECLSQAIYDPNSDGDIAKQGDAVH
jgi:hypothetical protein